LLSCTYNIFLPYNSVLVLPHEDISKKDQWKFLNMITLDDVIIDNRGTMFRCIQSKPYSFTTKIFFVNHRQNGYLFFYLSSKSSPGDPNSFGKSNKQNHKNWEYYEYESLTSLWFSWSNEKDLWTGIPICKYLDYLVHISIFSWTLLTKYVISGIITWRQIAWIARIDYCRVRRSIAVWALRRTLWVSYIAVLTAVWSRCRRSISVTTNIKLHVCKC